MLKKNIFKSHIFYNSMKLIACVGFGWTIFLFGMQLRGNVKIGVLIDIWSVTAAILLLIGIDSLANIFATKKKKTTKYYRNKALAMTIIVLILLGFNRNIHCPQICWHILFIEMLWTLIPAILIMGIYNIYKLK